VELQDHQPLVLALRAPDSARSADPAALPLGIGAAVYARPDPAAPWLLTLLCGFSYKTEYMKARQANP
jgi:hypothetical protein